MAGDEQKEYQWRETYFILFHSSARPTLTQLEHNVSELSDRFQLGNLTADDEGRFESVVIQAPDDYAALEISYETGEAVMAQAVDLAKHLQGEAAPDELARLVRADARLDVMHFEQVFSDAVLDGEDDLEEMLDPSCLLMVVEALVKLTDGIAIDPSSGAILP